MDITTNNFKSTLPTELIKKAQRCHVRECDEVTPNHFVSYVDESKESFDVSLDLEKSAIINHQCDCSDPIDFCHHKIALLSFIASGKSTAAKIAKTKKADPILEALEQADHEKLKAWILKIVSKNKDLGVAFLHEFTAQPTGYTSEEIIEFTQTAVKSILKKRTQADATELKKIVDLWSEIHLSVFTDYFANPADENNFQRLQTVIDICIEQEQNIFTSSKRLYNYVEKILKDAGQAIIVIKDQEVWKQALNHFLNQIYLPDVGMREWYLTFVTSVFHAETMSRRSALAGMMADYYVNTHIEQTQIRSHLMRFVFKLVDETHMFANYKQLFVPERHSLSYNLALINHLIEEGDQKLAAQYCQEEIAANTQDKYDYEYLLRLKEIYKRTGEEQELLNTLMKLLIHVPDFLDYQFVLIHHPEDEDFRKWKIKVLANAKKRVGYDDDAAAFITAVLSYDKG